MRKNFGAIAGLIFGLAVAIGVAQSNNAAAADTAGLDDVDIESLSDPEIEGVAFLPDKQGNDKCAGGSTPRCFRDSCPSATECPPKDQCYGALTCALYETVWKGGKQACSMLGDCSPPTSGGPIVIQ
jgi:hypothetical protein